MLAEWKLSIPAPLAARVDLLLLNPLTNKPRYGERSKITALFWEEYLSHMGTSSGSNRVILPLPNLPEVSFIIEGRSFTYAELAALTAVSKEAA